MTDCWSSADVTWFSLGFLVLGVTLGYLMGLGRRRG